MKATPTKKLQTIDPAFLTLPGARSVYDAGVKLKVHSDEISPATFSLTSSRWLAPIGFDSAGRPFYHNLQSGADPYNRENHHRASYRAYADEKYSYQSAGKFPKWVWIGAAVAAAAVGLALALKGKK